MVDEVSVAHIENGGKTDWIVQRLNERESVHPRTRLSPSDPILEHDNTKCSVGANIDPEKRIKGTGLKKHRNECKRLNLLGE